MTRLAGHVRAYAKRIRKTDPKSAALLMEAATALFATPTLVSFPGKGVRCGLCAAEYAEPVASALWNDTPEHLRVVQATVRADTVK